MQQKHDKEPVSAYSDQPLSFEESSSDTERKESTQEPTQSDRKTLKTNSVDGIFDIKDNSITKDKIYSVSKSDSIDDKADLKITEQSMKNIASSVKTPVIVNSGMTDQTTKQIIDTMTGNMNEIIEIAKREKENMTSENLVECDFWDFAGQKEYYATHQTFCSQDSIYLIVADINEKIEDTQPDEHFNHIGGNLKENHENKTYNIHLLQ